MPLVITNGTYFIRMTPTNGIEKTTNINEACNFKTKHKAIYIMNKAPKKTNNYFVPEKKPLLEESEMNVSKKGLMFSNIAFGVMLLIVVYMIIPWKFGSGLLLDKIQPTYIAKLFTDGAPFKEGIMLIFLLIIPRFD